MLMKYRHGPRRCDGIVCRPIAGQWASAKHYSDYTGGHTKLKKILLNGNNVAMVRNILRPLESHAICIFANIRQLIPGGMPDQN